MATGNRLKMRKKRYAWGQIALHVFFIALCFCYIYPFLLVISISLDKNAGASGFRIFPSEISLAAYEQVFANPERIFRAYGVTMFYSVVATLGALVVMSMFAYALSRREYKYRNIVTFLLFFTTLFNGGMVPSYIVNSGLLHLNDTIWIYILPSLLSAWNVIVIRSFFQGLPEGLCEAARIDGASEFRICFQIMIPLAKPALASVGFLAFIGHWNQWSITQIYIRNPELYSLQYLLQLILKSEDELKQMVQLGQMSQVEMLDKLRSMEPLRYAMAVVATGPMLFVFPVFQKYFAKGLTLGSVKG